MQNDGRSPSQNKKTSKHLSPSDVRRRAARKAERTALAEQGMLTRKPNTFSYFVNRLDPRRSIFESQFKQQDLNRSICCSSYDTAAMEHSGGRLSVMTWSAEQVAAELISQGWIKL
jgi:hypothetical protein